MEKKVTKVINMETIESVIFLFAGIMVIVFEDFLINNSVYLIAGIMIFEGLFNIIKLIIAKKIVTEENSLFENLIQFLLAIIILFILDKETQLETIYIIWGIWSIIKEGKELTEAFKNYLNKKPFLITTIESIFIIVLSVIMCTNPLEHVGTHIYLLGVELMIEGFYFVIEYIHHYFYLKKLKH